MKNEPFVIERTYNAPVARVWKAITNVEDMKQWYFDLPEFKAQVGNEFKFEGGDRRKYLPAFVQSNRSSERNKVDL